MSPSLIYLFRISNMDILLSTIAIKDTPTGVFSRSFNLAKGLVRNNHKVTLLTVQNDEFIFPYSKEVRNGVLIIAVPSFFKTKIKKFGYDFLPLFIKFIYVLFYEYDIVHSDLYRPSSLFPCIMHRFFKKSKLISDWQDINGKTGLYEYKSKIWKLTIGPIDNWLELYSKKISNGVVVLSDLLKEKSIKLGVKKDILYKLWGGSDLDKIKFFSSPFENRNKFNLSKSDFLIVFIGLETKDFLDNLTVFRSIQEANENRGANLKIVRTGKTFSDDFKKKYNIGSEIIDLGYVGDNDYGKLLSCADACMLMQESQNTNNLFRWPNVVGDYIAAGRPIIMNLMGELIELNKIYPEAIIEIESKEEDYLVARFVDIYNSKETLLEKYDKINDYAKSSFSWRIRAKELEKIYESILCKKVV